ncbi:carbohydrate ABC transporter permease [Streptomyces sp. Amel2xB2]|uniref:carbohydrate ABC transporter permease n=1 Tax=Streptomyces sp. Amel2xB2 TaxID=1305829 RepID=UPI000DBAAA8D|nr:sugar ABC transporter permease [Streptomyces sp. Amel2xB2]
MSLTPWRRTSGPTARSQLHGEGRMAAFLVSPTLLVLGLVIAYPVLSAVHSSLYSVPDIDPKTGFIEKGDPFVGLDNFTSIFSGAGDRFWNAFWNTSFLTVTSVILETVIGFAMALIMHQGIRGRAWIRASILVPWAIPTAISALLWRWIFDSEGIANSVLGTKVLWTTEGFQAQVAVIIAEVWKTAPFVGILVLAGLQIISSEVYEAARVDGAGPVRRLWSITLPLVKPALLVAVLFRLLDALRMFDLPYILIGAGKQSVETLSMLAQDEASNVRFGPASAYSVVLFLYVFLIAFAFIKLLGADLLGARDQSARGTRGKGTGKRPRQGTGSGRNLQKEATA